MSGSGVAPKALRLLFGHFFKILYWIFLIFLLYYAFQYPPLLLLVLSLLIAGPFLTIPAILAIRGHDIQSTKTIGQLQGVINSTFTSSGKWSAVPGDPGRTDFILRRTKPDCAPTVTVELEESDRRTVIVHVWMSEWTSGGLNQGRGTPFWVWGGYRAWAKVREVARAVAS